MIDLKRNLDGNEVDPRDHEVDPRDHEVDLRDHEVDLRQVLNLLHHSTLLVVSIQTQH